MRVRNFAQCVRDRSYPDWSISHLFERLLERGPLSVLLSRPFFTRLASLRLIAFTSPHVEKRNNALW